MEEQREQIKKGNRFVRVENYDGTHGYIGDTELFAQENNGKTYLFCESSEKLFRVVNPNAHDNGAIAIPIKWDSDLVRRLGEKYDQGSIREDLH